MKVALVSWCLEHTIRAVQTHTCMTGAAMMSGTSHIYTRLDVNTRSKSSGRNPVCRWRSIVQQRPMEGCVRSAAFKRIPDLFISVQEHYFYFYFYFYFVQICQTSSDEVFRGSTLDEDVLIKHCSRRQREPSEQVFKISHFWKLWYLS